MKRLIQWFCGYISVVLSGKQVNRFLNLCSRNGIRIWHMSYDLERRIKVHVRLRDFYDLKPFLRKTKTRLRIVKKRGFPFWCHRHPYFKWFPVFLCVVFVSFLYSRTYIWNISIEGNEVISEAELLDYLETENIKTGIRGKEIDCSQVELKIRKQYERIGWVSVFVDQTKLHIKVRESLYDTYDREEALNNDHRRFDLVADRDGKIISIVTRSGTTLVKVGDEIKEGQTLVKGTYEVLDDAGVVKSVQPVYGDAQIIGETRYKIELPLTEMEILGLKIAGSSKGNAIYGIANQKMNQIISFFEENGVIIIEKNVMIERKEKKVTIYVYVTGHSLMGIHVPVEEMKVHESE
jgi:similar to stage IV sporulation protein